jgi:hypothetical protein
MLVVTPFFVRATFPFAFIAFPLFVFTIAFHLCACVVPFFSLPTFPLCTCYCFLSLHLLQLACLEWLLLFVFVLPATTFFMLAVFPLYTCCCSLLHASCFFSSYLLLLPSSCLLLLFSSCLVLIGNDPKLNYSSPCSLIEFIKVDATLEEELEKYEDEFE